MTSVNILIPGLFAFKHYPIESPPTLPALNQLLSRARVCSSEKTYFSQLSKFIVFDNPTQHIPIAAILSTLSNSANRQVFCASPVHLKPDRDGLILHHGECLNIQKSEANQLISCFNEHFAEQSYTLQYANPHHWLLNLPKLEDICTSPLYDNLNKDINKAMPKGKNAVILHQLMNECQMLFHTAPVNLNREITKQPPINSLWFWGQEDSAKVLQKPDVIHHQNDFIVQQLINKIRCKLGDFDINGIKTGVHLLLVNELQIPGDYQDYSQWLEKLMALEETLFLPLLNKIGSREIEKACIYDGNSNTYCIKKLDLFKFWKRSQLPLS